jgi:hypothetical protein
MSSKCLDQPLLEVAGFPGIAEHEAGRTLHGLPTTVVMTPPASRITFMPRL